ncbi:MAG: hypothetical protein JNM69_35015 [Archangium sp.]|nr:hypothetical protein [Archangium sp.]
MRRLVPVVLFVVASSCSTTATVLTRDRKTTEAEIIGGDRDVLLLRNQYGLESIVRRAEVRDIDHPGNVVALLGGLLLGGGGLDLAVLGGFCARGSTASSSCTALFVSMGATAALGAGMLVWGLWAWLSSKNAVTNSLENPPVPMPVEQQVPLAPPPLAPSDGPAL